MAERANPAATAAIARQSILRKIIDQLGDRFNPAAQRAEYEAKLPQYRLYADLFEMDQDKLLSLVDSHVGEDPEKLQLRQQLAAVFNYVPTVIGMVINYVFSQSPKIESTNTDVQRFISNCDGTGTKLADYVKQYAAPLGLLYGYIDTLVQNPKINPLDVVTAADAAAVGMLPRVYTITPQQRIDWSSRQTHEYQWIRFIDVADEDPNPFRSASAAAAKTRYLTLSAAVAGVAENENGSPTAFWLASWRGPVGSNGLPIPEPEDPIDRLAGTPEKGEEKWIHEFGFGPMLRVPIETLYYKRSHDPQSRHEGLSKIATIATLTRKIIQLLSWTDEDVLANLAIFVFPGERPKDDKGNPIPLKLSPFSTFWKGKGQTGDAQMLQGDVEIIKIKMELIDVYIREILRLAFLIGAVGAEAEQITSGVQAVVTRQELLQECKDTAASLDSFTMGVLALAESWISSEDVTKEAAAKTSTVDFFKGPYATEPLEILIKNSKELITIFSRLSPEMVKQIHRQLAMSALQNDDATRTAVLAEIDDNFDAVQAENDQIRAELQASLAAGNAAANDGSGGTLPGDGVPTPAA